MYTYILYVYTFKYLQTCIYNTFIQAKEQLKTNTAKFTERETQLSDLASHVENTRITISEEVDTRTLIHTHTFTYTHAHSNKHTYTGTHVHTHIQFMLRALALPFETHILTHTHAYTN